MAKRLVTKLVTKQEAAAIARCSVRTIERAIAGGELRAGGVPGRRRLIELAELQRWLGLALVVVVLAVCGAYAATAASARAARHLCPQLERLRLPCHHHDPASAILLSAYGAATRRRPSKT